MHHYQINPASPYFSCLEQLKEIPSDLYVDGDFLPIDQNGIAIVGTRNCTIYGREMAYQIARAAAAEGFTVISGFARGIDTAAHLGALENGRTIAILGSGFNHLYPKENSSLGEKIKMRGALVSEYSPDTPPAKHQFPKRNRLISAFASAVICIEAPIKSGALISMRYAYSLGKKCFAIPGRADMETFEGNHELIKKGEAELMTSINDLLKYFRKPTSEISFIYNEGLALDPAEKKILEILPSYEVNIEFLLDKSELSVAKLSAILIGLILKQKVREFPGKNYKRIS